MVEGGEQQDQHQGKCYDLPNGERICQLPNLPTQDWLQNNFLPSIGNMMADRLERVATQDQLTEHHQQTQQLINDYKTGIDEKIGEVNKKIEKASDDIIKALGPED